jgi:hypothetical protein
MSTTEIILAIISSSVISAILTSYFNWRIHNSNYKKDYYKKLLDRRLDAYESLNLITNLMSDIVYTEQGMVHGILCGELGFDNFKSNLSKMMNKNFWLDDVTGHKLTELNIFLFNEVSGYIDDSWPKETIHKKYIELGIKHYEKIEDFKSTLKYFLNNELKNLHKLDDFFKDNRVGNKTYPVYEKEINKK